MEYIIFFEAGSYEKAGVYYYIFLNGSKAFLPAVSHRTRASPSNSH